MATWIGPRRAVPWLRGRPPYFVPCQDEEDLVRGLEEAGFDVRLLDGTELVDEVSLLTAIGETFGFPDYYGGNWDAYLDCIGDIAESAGSPLALVWSNSDRLLAADPRIFTRAVHILLDSASDLAASDAKFQFEVFVTGTGPGYVCSARMSS